jgi:ubiquitin carboxyl-terminal hydrolase 4/11/15
MKTYHGDVTWDLHHLHPEDEWAVRWDEPWAFEIDDDSNALWVPAILRMKARGTDDYVAEETILGPFLMPVGDDLDIARAAAARLAWLWPTEVPSDRPPLSSTAIELRDRLVIPDEPPSDEPRLRATTWQSVTRSFEIPCASSAGVTITLRPSAFAPDAHIDLDGLGAVALAFSDVTVPTVASRRGAITLEDCFAQFSQSEVLDEQNQWLCPHCRQFVCASKTMDIWSVPRVLVVHLKRVVTSGYHTRKLETIVDYPNELDMSRFVVGPQKNSPVIYQLYAVSEHMGSLGGGHYTAHALVQDNGKSQWFDFNDSSAWEARQEDAHGMSAYLLFYQRMDENDPIAPLDQSQAAPAPAPTLGSIEPEALWRSSPSSSDVGETAEKDTGIF